MDVHLYRRDFRRTAFTSLLLSWLAKLFQSEVIREAAEEMHWNAVVYAENAMDLATTDLSHWPPARPVLPMP